MYFILSKIYESFRLLNLNLGQRELILMQSKEAVVNNQNRTAKMVFLLNT